MIRIITLLGLAFLLASCGEKPEKEAEPETTQTPADDLATAKADANAKIVIAKALKAKTTDYIASTQVAYQAAAKNAKNLALQLEIDLTTSTDVNKIKTDTKELERLITIATSMTKASANVPDAVAQANKAIADANNLPDPATIANGAGHDEIVTKITDIKKVAAAAPKSVGLLTAAITVATDPTNTNTAANKILTLDTATEVLRKRIIKISNLIADRKAAIAAAQAEIDKANGFADTAPGVYLVDNDYRDAVLAAKTGDANNAADKLKALIEDAGNNAKTVANVKKMTKKLKTLIAAVEAVGTIAKQAAAMKLYTDLGADLTAATVTNANLTAAFDALNGLNTNEKAYVAGGAGAVSATVAMAAIKDEQDRRAALALYTDLGADLKLATVIDANLTNAFNLLNALTPTQKAANTDEATNAMVAIKAEQDRRAAIVVALATANGYTTTQIAAARNLYESTRNDGTNTDGKTPFNDKTKGHPATSRAIYLTAIEAAEDAVATAITAINAAPNALAASGIVDGATTLDNAIKVTLAGATQAFSDAIAQNP